MNQSKFVALSIVMAALYLALLVAFMPISYGPIQVRVAASLNALIPVIGWPAVIGLTIGHTISGMMSPMGFLDWIFVPMSFAVKLVVLGISKKTGHQTGFLVGTPIHVLAVALYVGWMLSHLFGLPMLPTMLWVGVGESIAQLGIGGFLYFGLRNKLTKWVS